MKFPLMLIGFKNTVVFGIGMAKFTSNSVEPTVRMDELEYRVLQVASEQTWNCVTGHSLVGNKELAVE